MASDDPTTWFPVGDGNDKSAPAPATTKSPASDDPTTWFPVGKTETAPQPRQPAPPLPNVSEYGDLGNAWWNTQANPPPGEEGIPVVGVHAPGYVQSDILPLARRQDVINDPNSRWYQGWAIAPGPLRAVGQTPAENVLINPNTGTMNIAPEALSAASMLGGISRPPTFGAPREFVAPGVLDPKASLSPEFKANPLSAEAKAATDAAPGGPTSSTGVSPPPPPPQPEPKFSGAGAPTTDALGPKTSADAKAVAGQLYAKADAAGGTLTPAFVDKFIDEAGKIAPQTEAGRVVAGATPVTELATRLADLKGKSISLQGAQEIDQALGKMIDKEYTTRGLSGDGKDLLDLQSKFREMIANADESQIAGGKAGFDAVVEARKAWSQAMKMQDLERIQERANMTDNPATGIKSGIRTLLSNPSRAKAYSPEEIAALKDAAERGVLGGALHVFGSRLIPIAAGAAGYTGGVIGTLASAGAAHVLSSGSRAAATALQNQRMTNALSILGRSVPPPPAP